jgi:hypothetical protein
VCAHVLNLLDGKVRVRGDTLVLWSHVDDDHDWTLDVALEEVVDLMVRGAQLRARVIPADHLLPRCTPCVSHRADEADRRDSRTVDLLEHLEHALDVVVVEEPRLAVLLVFLERDAERVRDVDRLPVVLAQEHADNALVRCASDGASMVVRHREEHERVDDCERDRLSRTKMTPSKRD